MISRIKDILTILFNPIWWNMNNKYCEKWDKELNDLMDNYKFETFIFYNEISTHYIKIANKQIWIENYPYAAFTSHDVSGVRPSRFTILRAKRKMKYDLLSKEEKRNFILEEIL
jgi:hypothetical protein